MKKIIKKPTERTAKPVLKELIPKILEAFKKHDVVTNIPTTVASSKNKEKNNLIHLNNLFVTVIMHMYRTNLRKGVHTSHMNAYYISSDAKNITHYQIKKSKSFHPNNALPGHSWEPILKGKRTQNYTFNNSEAEGIPTYFCPKYKAALKELANDKSFIDNTEFYKTIQFILYETDLCKKKRQARPKKKKIKTPSFFEFESLTLNDFEDRRSLLVLTESKIAVALMPQLVSGAVIEMKEASSGRLYGALSNLHRADRMRLFHSYWDIDLSNSVTNSLYHHVLDIDPTVKDSLSSIKNYIENKDKIRDLIRHEANITPRMVKGCISSLAHCSPTPSSGQIIWDEKETYMIERKAEKEGNAVRAKSVFSMINTCTLDDDERNYLINRGENIHNAKYNRHVIATRLINSETYQALVLGYRIMTDAIVEYYKATFVDDTGRNWLIPNFLLKELEISLKPKQHFPKGTAIAHIYQGLEAAKLHIFLKIVPNIYPYHDGFVCKDKLSDDTLAKLINEIYLLDGEVVKLTQKQYPMLLKETK